MAAKFLALSTLLLGAIFSGAQEDPFREGEHYRIIQTPFEAADADPDVIEVVEMFSYACVHCYNFEEELNAWVAEQADDVIFRRVHVVFNQHSFNLAKAYFAAEELDVVDEVHEWIYSAIHINRLRMQQKDLLTRLFESRGGIPAEQFHDVFDGFTVQNQVRKSDQLIRVWRIQSTPSLVVDGRYVAGGTSIRSNSQLLPVVDFLLDKVRSERST